MSPIWVLIEELLAKVHRLEVENRELRSRLAAFYVLGETTEGGDW